MPRFKETDTAVPTPDPAEQPPVIETASIYNATHTDNNVIAYIEGDSWVVDYFNQYYGDEDVGTTNYDVNDPTLKQYSRIKDFELRLTDPLNQDYDQAVGTSAITGTANVYPVLTPTAGDVFIGQVNDNKFALFSVTSVERLSFYKESAFAIEFTFMDYMTDVLHDDLKEKTVNVQHFDLKGMLGRRPALRTESEWQRDIERKELRYALIEEYFINYYRRDNQTFIVPDSEVLDPFLVNFWNRMIGVTDIRGFDAPKTYNLINAIYKAPYKTVWDAFADQSVSTLRYCAKTMTEVHTGSFGAAYTYYTLETTRVQGVVQPVEVNGIAINTFDSLTAQQEPYIFSQAFYDEDVDNMSELEELIYRGVQGVGVIPYGEVKTQIDNVQAMPTKDRFYYLPFLIAILGITR